MKKVSVIIPVYKVEKYLRACLESVVNQTLKDIEIIVVNDGSPDNCQTIIDEYQQKYPKLIKSIQKENGGISDARNYGLDIAKGEYIAFLDSDDTFALDALEKMYNKAKSEDFDVVACDVLYIYENGNPSHIASSSFEKDLFTKEEIKKALISLYPSAWNKIYKRSTLTKKYYFKKGVYFEDVEFAYRYFTNVTTIGIVKEPLINYLKREGAITMVFDKKLYHYIDNMNSIIEFYKENNLYDEYKKELEYSYVRYLYATFIKASTNYSKKDYQEAVDAAIKNVKQNFKNYRRNPYFYKSLKGLFLLSFNKPISNIYYQLNKRKD